MSKHKDVIVGAVSFALSIALFAAAYGIKEFSRTRLGADFVPRITAVVLGILGIVLILRSIREWRRTDAAAPQAAAAAAVKPAGFHGAPAAAVNIALFIAYLLLLEPVGFVITTPLYMFFQIMLLTDRTKFRPVLYAVISVVVCTGAYLAFRELFQVFLPPGILELDSLRLQ